MVGCFSSRISCLRFVRKFALVLGAGSSTTLTCACPLIVESLQSSRLKKKLETTLPIGVHRCKTPFCKPGQARQNWLMRASYRLRPLVLVLVVIGWDVARDFSVNYNFFRNPSEKPFFKKVSFFLFPIIFFFKALFTLKNKTKIHYSFHLQFLLFLLNVSLSNF